MLMARKGPVFKLTWHPNFVILTLLLNLTNPENLLCLAREVRT